MAKLYKVEMYILDVNDEYGSAEEIIENNCRQPSIFKTFNTQEVEIKWDDEIDINFKDCSVENYRRYFRGTINQALIGDIVVLDNGEMYELRLMGDDEFCTFDIKQNCFATSGYSLKDGDLSKFVVGGLIYGHTTNKYRIVEIKNNTIE